MKKRVLPILSEAPQWRQILRTNFRRIEPLADYLQLTPQQRRELEDNSPFLLNLPQRLASKIPKGVLDDPILRQFLPTKKERKLTTSFCHDPLDEQHHTPARLAPKLLHKYRGRALLLVSSSCAMHCRYCFRREFDYAAQSDFQQEIALIRADPTLKEIILSGGDPLSLSNQQLHKLLTQLSSIAHLKHIRFHTRFPIGIPERIDRGLLQLLSAQPQRVWLVIHSNHARELDTEVLAALKQVQQCGVVVLNQAVLLKGVNDQVETLVQLCSLLIDNGIMPYYLHQLDRVTGTAHFEVSRTRGRQLIAAMRAHLPGYGVPKYVQEISGKLHKVAL